VLKRFLPAAGAVLAEDGAGAAGVSGGEGNSSAFEMFGEPPFKYFEIRGVIRPVVWVERWISHGLTFDTKA